MLPVNLYDLGVEAGEARGDMELRPFRPACSLNLPPPHPASCDTVIDS